MMNCRKKYNLQDKYIYSTNLNIIMYKGEYNHGSDYKDV